MIILTFKYTSNIIILFEQMFCTNAIYMIIFDIFTIAFFEKTGDTWVHAALNYAFTGRVDHG